MSIGSAPATLSDDLLEGAEAIAKFMYGSDDAKKRRKVYGLLERKRKGLPPPIIKNGATLEARKSAILQWYEDREREVRVREPKERKAPGE